MKIHRNLLKIHRTSGRAEKNADSAVADQVWREQRNALSRASTIRRTAKTTPRTLAKKRSRDRGARRAVVADRDSGYRTDRAATVESAFSLDLARRRHPRDQLARRRRRSRRGERERETDGEIRAEESTSSPTGAREIRYSHFRPSFIPLSRRARRLFLLFFLLVSVSPLANIAQAERNIGLGALSTCHSGYQSEIHARTDVGVR